jgi:two-component system, response regulator
VSHPGVEILLVEDNLDDTRLIVQALKQAHPAVSMTVTHDGAEALDCIFNTGAFASRLTPYTPQLILLDLNLPKVSGYEVLRVIRAYARTRSIPAIIISGSPEEQAIGDSYDLGANSHVMKPSREDQFRESVQQMAGYWLNINQPYSPDDSAAATDRDGLISQASDAET